MSIQSGEHGRRVLAVALVFGAILGIVLFLFSEVGPTSSSGGGEELQLSVDPPEACTGSVCVFEPDEAFTLSVDVVNGPSGGYVGVQSFINFGDDLVYNISGTRADELAWPDCETATLVRDNNPLSTVSHGCLSGLFSPPLSEYTGSAFAMSFNCSPSASSTLVRLLPFLTPAEAELIGTEEVIELYGTLSSITSGAGFQVEAGGDTTAAKVNDLTIFCGDPPTPTPGPTITPGGATVTPTPTPQATPTASPTPSATPTPTATFISVLPCGDVNGDRLVNSQDALWVLWFSTGQIPFLPFPADVDGDGVTGPLDALFILWIELRLYICR